MSTELGAWIRESRKARKWNQTRIGQILGVRIRGFYEVRARPVEPVGLVYLWPEAN